MFINTDKGCNKKLKKFDFIKYQEVFYKSVFINLSENFMQSAVLRIGIVIQKFLDGASLKEVRVKNMVGTA
jgi:hypothetical protein